MGTITLTYVGDNNGVNVSSSATIDDADAAIVVAWATTPQGSLTFIAPPGSTAAQTWPAIGVWFLSLLATRVASYQRQTAATSAANAVIPVTITPKASAI